MMWVCRELFSLLAHFNVTGMCVLFCFARLSSDGIIKKCSNSNLPSSNRNHPKMQNTSRSKNVFFVVLTALLFFGAGEVLLRAVGFHYSNTPLEMQFLRREQIQTTIDGNSLTNRIKFKKDPVQFWVPEHSFEQEIPIKKPQDTLRIAALGDSCTQGCAEEWGKSSYPGFLGEILKARMPGRKIEILNAGVGSYSSYQGLKRLERVVLKYHPDLLIIYFGWNDHWIAPQQDKDVKMFSDFEVGFFNLVEHSRFFKLLHSVIADVMGRTLSKSRSKAFAYRVSPEDYGKNLGAMLDLAQAQHVSVILVTAPQNIRNHWSPSALFPFRQELLEGVHGVYNNVVRKLAMTRHVDLLDLDQIVQHADADRFMSKDGIHFHPQGCRLVAEVLAQKIQKEKLLER